MTDTATVAPPAPAHLAAIVQSSLDAIIGESSDGLITLWNPAAERIFGFAATEALGRPGTLIVPDDRLDEARRVRVRLERGDHVEHFETVRCTREGRPLAVSLAISAVLDEDGLPVGTATIARDITAQRQATEEISRSLERLAHSEKLAAMGELLAGVAHEINNPLAVVLGQTALLDSASAPPPIRERARKIKVAADRCARIIKNFLAIARQRPPERALTDLNRIVNEAAELLAYELKTNGVTVSLELSPELPKIMGDGHRLHQLMVNLLVNACHALRPAAPPRRLTLATRLHAGQPQLEVADNGPGIAAAVLPHIFDPFFTTKPSGEGTGLGLSLCRQVAQEHAGTITVTSEPGQGASFLVTLPAEAVAEPPRPASAPVVRPARILVVDDEIDVAALLRDTLALDGHAVDVAPDGAAALQMLERERYDLLLSDAKMPVVNGVELLQAVEQRMPEYRERMIFVTGDTVSREKVARLEQAGVPIMLKPFDIGEMQDLVRAALSRQQREVVAAVGSVSGSVVARPAPAAGAQPANAWWRARARAGTE